MNTTYIATPIIPRGASFLAAIIALFTLTTFSAQAAPQTSAAFVGTDTKTEGNWQTAYGADGYSLAGSSQSAPAYASFTPQSEQTITWAAKTNNVLALQTGVGSARIAAAWDSRKSFDFDVNITDGNVHRFAVYAIDWNTRERSETVVITNANSGTALDTRSVSNFTSGLYLIWNVRGHVHVSVTLSSGPNAVISGAFFGGARSVVEVATSPSTSTGTTTSTSTSTTTSTSTSSTGTSTSTSSSTPSSTGTTTPVSTSSSTPPPSTPTVVAPAITQQPASQTILVGKTASFSVADTGTAPLTYQWSKNSSAISGATSSTYTTPAVSTSDNGSQFTVSVSNGAGVANSTAAVLTVNPGTPVLSASVSSLSFGSVNVSSSSTQNVTLTNSGTASVTISSVSVSGAGFNALGVASGTVLQPGQTATLDAVFAPATGGAATGTVSVSSNASASAMNIALSGTGVAPVAYNVVLNWAASTSTVVGYNAYFSLVSGGPYTKLTSAPVAVTDYDDTTVQNGQTRFYVITSVNSSNVESSYSQEVSVQIP